MNQILVTQKLYITPELKRKKKTYQVTFFLSIFTMIMLSCAYIYAEYDKNKAEDLSQDILQQVVAGEIEISQNGNLEGDMDETTITQRENALIVAITAEQAVEEETEADEQQEVQQQPVQNQTPEPSTENDMLTQGKYKDSKGNEYSIAGIVKIPKINVEYPIISEWSDKLLKVSVCKFWGPNPNEVGNFCIVGHNYKNSKFFSKVPKLSIGDIVEIIDLTGRTIQYKAYDIYTVDPSDTRCTSQLTQGKKEITLITCTNDSKQRVVVKCTEVI